MDAENQQRILGYFIEEAKEHLETLEKGILELSIVVEDSERINEVFRAAHSLKGGAAMLNLSSIQKTAHLLEDGFKVLKEHQDLPVDQRLENLFWDGYDVLQDLIERLQSSFGLQNGEAEEIIQKAQPTFIELQNYLNDLINGKQGDINTSDSTTIQQSNSQPQSVTEEAKKLLKQMLQLFKQKPSPQNRQELQRICECLGKLAPSELSWNDLINTAAKACANPKYSYSLLAPVVIKEIKQGADYLELGQPQEICPSEGLYKLSSAGSPQILVTVEPKAAAKTLGRAFNQQQLSQLVKLLQTSS